MVRFFDPTKMGMTTLKIFCDVNDLSYWKTRGVKNLDWKELEPYKRRHVNLSKDGLDDQANLSKETDMSFFKENTEECYNTIRLNIMELKSLGKSRQFFLMNPLFDMKSDVNFGKYCINRNRDFVNANSSIFNYSIIQFWTIVFNESNPQ